MWGLCRGEECPGAALRVRTPGPIPSTTWGAPPLEADCTIPELGCDHVTLPGGWGGGARQGVRGWRVWLGTLGPLVNRRIGRSWRPRHDRGRKPSWQRGPSAWVTESMPARECRIRHIWLHRPHGPPSADPPSVVAGRASQLLLSGDPARVREYARLTCPADLAPRHPHGIFLTPEHRKWTARLPSTAIDQINTIPGPDSCESRRPRPVLRPTPTDPGCRRHWATPLLVRHALHSRHA